MANAQPAPQSQARQGGRLPRAFIDELLSRVDIVDLIGSRVPLKKAGKDFQARCPFHDENTPSFTVSRDKQFYHCFGCGAHGSAIGFLMEYDRLGFVDAIEVLAQQVGVEVPREAGGRQRPDSRPLYELMQEAQRWFQAQLRSHPEATRARDYLQGRGLSGEIANAYAIGYAPPGWDNLLQRFGSEPETIQRLSQVGLLAENEAGRRYDRFRDRIMFPIRDPRGRTIGFGGRVLDDSKPKYLNSPETSLFQKGREIYGLFEARQAARQLDRLLVTEGYMDVIALAQFGIRYAVATLGTAATGEHLERLFHNAPELVFCFDGDQAGRDAAWKALEQTLPLMRDGRQARFLFLPDGEDPDSLIRSEGPVAFESRMGQAKSLSVFLFEKLAEGLDLASDEGRARLFDQARPRLQRLPQGVLREMLLRRLEAMLALPKRQLEAFIAQSEAGGRFNAARIDTRPGAGSVFSPPHGFHGTADDYLRLMRNRYTNQGIRARLLATAALVKRRFRIDIAGPFSEQAQEIVRALAFPDRGGDNTVSRERAK